MGCRGRALSGARRGGGAAGAGGGGRAGAGARIRPVGGGLPRPAAARLGFGGVDFRWRPDLPEVFDGLTMEIPAGSVSGCWARRVPASRPWRRWSLKVAAPQSGRVILGGVDIATLTAADGAGPDRLAEPDHASVRRHDPRTICCWPGPSRMTPRCGPRWTRRRSATSCARCRTAWRPGWGRAARGSPAARGGAWRWPARCCHRRRS